MEFNKLIAIISSLLTLASAWHLSVNSEDNWCGARRTYFSASATNQCYDFSSDVAGKIHSLAWCTSISLERCVVTFHSGEQCTGTLLKTKNPPGFFSGDGVDGTDLFRWETTHSTNEVKAKSFKVQGCINWELPTGIRDCYDQGKAPWDTARWCT